MIVSFMSLVLLPVFYAQTDNWHTIETVKFPWLSGRSPYALIVEEQTTNRNATEGPRLRIQVPGKRDFVLSVPGGVVRISDGLLDKKLAADNALKSSYLYLTPKLKGTGDALMLVVFGGASGSDPGSLNVLSLDRNGYPVNVFNSETFELMAVTDIDGDGTCEIVGKHCLSQSWGPCLLTYDPYSVYRLPSWGGKATMSLDLSKKYNLRNYYGWAGPRCREDIAVVPCASKGKPRIMSTERAKRLGAK